MSLPATLKYCEAEVRGHVFIVKLNRPKNMNSIHPNVSWELTEVWDHFEANDDLWVGVLTGNGRAFSAGNDLKATAGVDSDGDGGTFKGLKERRGRPFFGGVVGRRMVKPVIAAVNGVAHGGGFELALACDIIIASEQADFALPEVKVGLFAAAGGVIKLPKLIGYQNAMRMILTGKRVLGAEAVQLGIACELVKEGHDILAAALAIADEIQVGNPDAVQASLDISKHTFWEATPFSDAMRDQYNFEKFPTVQRWQKGPNMKEGPKAFSEKRKPKWANPAPLPKANL